MLHHHTTDPAQRAMDIAEREAVNCSDGIFEYFSKTLEIYQEVLWELLYNPTSN